jgi:multiple sugar transport system permease protein
MFIYRESFTFWRMGMGAAASFVSLAIITILVTFFFKSLNRDRAATE